MVTVKTDYASFTGAGHGTLRIPSGVHLAPGQVIAVIDDEADTLEAEVLAFTADKAEVRVHWDHIVRRA
jgi:hypothetical protein